MFKTIKNWIVGSSTKVIPTQSNYLPSDVVSLVIIRKDEQGNLIKFQLTGEDADRWGWLMSNTGKYVNPSDGGKGFSELDWKKIYIDKDYQQ